MLGATDPRLINILGHAGGALIFVIFLSLLYSRRGWSGARGRNLTAAAAMLSIVWDLGSLLVLTRPTLSPLALNLLVALSFSAFSLLPAVLLHLSVGDSRPMLVRAGYVLSGIAVLMHFGEVRAANLSLHQSALLLITLGFLTLTGIAAATMAFSETTRRGSGARILLAMALALFAASFVHFGAEHASQAWSAELLVHHAGIPLALFILLQDYRFVLLDAFVRFLANGLLALLVASAMIEAIFRLTAERGAHSNPFYQALLLVAVSLGLLLFAWLRKGVQAWLTKALFRRDGLAELPAILRNAPAFSSEQEYLEWAAKMAANAARTRQFAVVSGEPDLREYEWAEAMAPMRLGGGNPRTLLLGAREGGRRYLGADLDVLAVTAAEMTEYVESLRREEMRRLVSQAELRALQSQIHPHFLFNALNTLYGVIPREASTARRIVLNLADIFRYFLQSDTVFVPLSREIQIVRAYLEIEQLRLGPRLRVEIEVDNAVLETPIPVLSVQPLVENAIKHGVAVSSEPGYVRIHAELRGGRLRIAVENSRAGSAQAAGTGVGLQNVRRRLEICYGSASGLKTAFEGEHSSVELTIPAEGREQTPERR